MSECIFQKLYIYISVLIVSDLEFKLNFKWEARCIVKETLIRSTITSKAVN